MKAEISMPQVVRQITLEAEVTGVQRTRLRLWLGRKIMMLAAAVMGCNIDVKIEQ